MSNNKTKTDSFFLPKNLFGVIANKIKQLDISHIKVMTEIDPSAVLKFTEKLFGQSICASIKFGKFHIDLSADY